MKKLLTLVLALALVFAAFSGISAFAEEEEETYEPEVYEPEVYEPEVFEPEYEPEPIVTGDAATVRIDVARKMAVAFEDGTVYYGGEMMEVTIGQEYMFQMCSRLFPLQMHSKEQ